MEESYNKWYGEYKEIIGQFSDDSLYSSLDSIVRSSENVFSLNRRLMQKTVDISWVEAIENGLVHVDNVLRTPRRTIEDVEEIVPIALSRKITVESVKHLAQHTDLIQSYDKRTGRVTPSKILNVHKEESLVTYENKFVNTLIDRLYIFINTRYQKLAQVAKDEEVYTLGYDTQVDDGEGGNMKISIKMESATSLDTRDQSGYTIWQRVEKIKKAIEGYKGSELCTVLGNSFIRPPVMRTNAIMKNVDLKACLTLWQYIESYDKVGYEINIEDTAVQPDITFSDDFFKLITLHFLLFRTSTDAKKGFENIDTNKLKSVAPIFVKNFQTELSANYNESSEGVAGYISEDGELRIKSKMPEDMYKVYEQIEKAISIEEAYQEELERKRIEDMRHAEEEERKRQEQERIDRERQKELERLQKQQEEEERKLQELLAQKRAEQEAEKREQEKAEQERLAMLAEKQRQEEEERQRLEEERVKREEEERIQAERDRISSEKQLVRSELGEAEGISEEKLTEKTEETENIEVTDEEVKQVAESTEEEIEDPRAVAVRMKLEQQKREKERKDTERAQRLKAERQYFEQKPFREIYKEYSKNPIYLIPRLIMHILAVVFGLIPEDTDNPDYKTMLARNNERKVQLRHEKDERERMERYYRKYARTFKYRFLRSIDDRKFKKKRRKEMRNRPKPVYNPPVRTPEQEQAVQQEMKRLYREYHVSVFERIHRSYKEFKRNRSQRK